MEEGERGPRARGTPLALAAALLALLGAVLAVAVPLLPVRQHTTALAWPQQGSYAEVTAPLVAYTPVELRAEVSCDAVRAVGDDGLVLGTAPPEAPDSGGTALLARREAGDLLVSLRGIPALRVPAADLTGGGCGVAVTSLPGSTTLSAAGQQVTLDGDVRPQLVGVFTDLRGAAGPGVSLRAEVDDRYDSSPTPLKLLATGLAVLGLGAGLLLLRRLDRAGAHTAPRRRPRPRPGWSDGLVVAVLGAWWLVGSTTSDDGYLTTMARAAGRAGYIGNYYRWFNSPEAPFGWYYELYARMVGLGTATLWLRVPALLLGLATWLVVTRAVLPRLGAAVHLGPARWAAAAVLLAFWLPFGNGLRPEAPIALGVVLTWVLVEHAVAGRRLLPLAAALLTAAFSLAAGPTGLAAVAVLLVAVRPLSRMLAERVRESGALAVLAPMLAAGTAVLVVVFGDQTLATVREATRVRTELGPSLPWFAEPYRYTALLTGGADGGLARRYPVLLLLLLVVLVAAVVLRRGTVPGAAHGPGLRLVASTALGLASLTLTPTKWTHHFGVFAGLAAGLGALATVAVGAAVLRSVRHRAVATAAVLVVLAFALTGPNAWWYASSWGVPFAQRPPAVAGVALSSVALAAAGVAALVALREHLRVRPAPDRRRPRLPARVGGVLGAPVTAVTMLVVAGLVGSFVLSTAARWPAYTIGQQDLRSVAGGSCGLADAVRVEQPAFGGALTPEDPGTDPLDVPADTGFTRDGVPPALLEPGSAQTGAGGSTDATSRGGSTAAGGSSVSAPLPAGLDPATTTVLGSWTEGEQRPSSATTGWVALPTPGPDTPVVAVTAAGSVAAITPTGQAQPGGRLDLELGTGPAGSVTATGTRPFQDPTGGPAWRTLRVPVSEIPAGTTWVRLVLEDADTSPDKFVAVTAPRLPPVATLSSVLGPQDPVLPDWLVGASFPCVRPFTVADGVAEVPVARLTPGETGRPTDVVWETAPGGGPLGWTRLLGEGRALTSYLSDDLGREWGTVIVYRPFRPDAVPAQLETGERVVGGLERQPSQWLPPLYQRD
ncbi:arabinosyltransferase EmbC [Rhodococcus aerolatus]